MSGQCLFLVIMNYLLLTALGGLRQKDHTLKGNLGYTERSCLKSRTNESLADQKVKVLNRAARHSLKFLNASQDCLRTRAP